MRRARVEGGRKKRVKRKLRSSWMLRPASDEGKPMESWDRSLLLSTYKPEVLPNMPLSNPASLHSNVSEAAVAAMLA